MSGSSQLYRIKCQIFSVFKSLCTSPGLRGTSCPDQCSVIGSQCSEFSDGPSPRRSVLHVHGPSLDLSPVTCSCRELPGSEQNSSPWRPACPQKTKVIVLYLKTRTSPNFPAPPPGLQGQTSRKFPTGKNKVKTCCVPSQERVLQYWDYMWCLYSPLGSSEEEPGTMTCSPSAALHFWVWACLNPDFLFVSSPVWITPGGWPDGKQDYQTQLTVSFMPGLY